MVCGSELFSEKMEVPTLIIFFILISFVNSQITFDQYKQTYNLAYSNSYAAEIAQQTFNMNNALVAIINYLESLKQLPFKLGVNEFSSTPFAKFEKTHMGTKIPEDAIGNSTTIYVDPEQIMGRMMYDPVDPNVPKAVDYRNTSLEVQNQMSCGCCWAFATMSTLESRMIKLNSSYNTILSPQYSVDCDTYNNGCSGGWPMNALRWIVQVGGNSVPSMSSYRYLGFKTKCRNTPKIPMKITAMVQNYTGGNEDMMKEIVATVGPVTAVVSATNYFQLYKSGIFFDTTCNTSCQNLNHAVTIVGYGTNTTTKMDYWIVKNTWGKSWGQDGYIYMSRNTANNCNIACYAIYAI